MSAEAGPLTARRAARTTGMSLTLRLSLAYLLLTLAGIMLLGTGLTALARNYLADQRAQELGDQAAIYAALLGQLADSPAALQGLAGSGLGRELLPAGAAARIFSLAGDRLAGDPALGPFPSRPALALVRPLLPLPASQAAGRSYAARSIPGPSGPIGVVEISRATGGDERLLASLAQITLQAALAAGAVMALASLLVARSIARPILRVARRAEGLADGIAGDAAAESPRRQPNEIARLASSLDRLADGLRAYTARIEELEQARVRFYRNVSHELRTPLTAIQATVENLTDAAPAGQRPALETIEAEALRMGRLVDELLRPPADGRLLAGPRERIALGALAREVCALLAGRAARAGVRLEAPGQDGPTTSGDRDRLKQALLNLLDNAMRVTPPGGSVMVAVASHGAGVRLSVTDSGPGVPPELRERMWERGVRGDDPAHTGAAGLGLAIVRDIVAAHAGSVALDPAYGPGARFVIDLPSDE